MSKDYTVIMRRKGMIYPARVYGAKSAVDAERHCGAIFGAEYEMLATVHAHAEVSAREYGIGYEVYAKEENEA